MVLVQSMQEGPVEGHKVPLRKEGKGKLKVGEESGERNEEAQHLQIYPEMLRSAGVQVVLQNTPSQTCLAWQPRFC